MNPRPVNTKKDFYRRFQKGEFGNRSETWETYDEYVQSGYEDFIVIRSKTPGGPCIYFLERKTVPKALETFHAKGYYDLNFSAQCPEQDTELKGEVCLTHRGLFLRGSFSTLPMREAIKNHAFNAVGLTAHLVIRNSMNASSWDWLQHLLATYTEHVIEFTALRYCWGTNPGHNTLFWEVRNY
jgi:hypothetical protein